MIEISPLKKLDLADLERVASGYTSNGKYEVTYFDSEEQSSVRLQFVENQKPYDKKFDHDDETLQRYLELLHNGFSFGAYDGDLLVGLILAEPSEWNRSLWVWEFHVAETHRNQGIGKRLMERAAESAKGIHLRTIICETQNTNANAIHVYRRLGFRVEGIDISYYTNDDHPDGEVAVFMKRRL